ncbi:hypothetical protein HID58_082261, partial [Brassica napus]
RKFEFQLRLQEFIELVRADSYKQAIHYARTHLTPWGAHPYERIAACPGHFGLSKVPRNGIHNIREFCKLYGMTVEPLLNIYSQAGLSALKTPGFVPRRTRSHKRASEASVAFTLLPKQEHSKLICYISKELMDTENPPLVLPNGYVYSTKALADKNKGEGKMSKDRVGLQLHGLT